MVFQSLFFRNRFRYFNFFVVTLSILESDQFNMFEMFLSPEQACRTILAAAKHDDGFLFV